MAIGSSTCDDVSRTGILNHGGAKVVNRVLDSFDFSILPNEPTERIDKSNRRLPRREIDDWNRLKAQANTNLILDLAEVKSSAHTTLGYSTYLNPHYHRILRCYVR